MRPGDLIAERFEIEHAAGEGGMGTVFRARDRQSDDLVALKVLSAAARDDAERFRREAELLASLHHPGIVRHVAHGTSRAGEPWLAMEWLDGEDLSARLARGPLRPDDALTIALQSAEALGAAHARGIVHRDIKPANLFLLAGEALRVKVVDFGIARAGGAIGMRARTRTGTVIGTPGYIAPEQVRAERDVDARADVFSLGAVLFECLTGEPPFVGNDVLTVLARVLFQETPRLSERLTRVPPVLEQLVTRMLDKDRAQRPPDATAVARELSTMGAVPTLTLVLPGSATALGESERRWVSVVVLQDPGARAVDATARTVHTSPPDARELRVVAIAERYAARLETLPDGARVMLLSGEAAATDLATRAARTALALREVACDGIVAVASGYGRVRDALPLGEALEKAVALVRCATDVDRTHVLLDDATAGLLPARFELALDGERHVLRGEHEVADETRTVLGRVTPFVGRERELRTLLAIWDECTAEHVARAALVLGPAGIGKSRLQREFVHTLQERDAPFELWLGRTDGLGAGSPFGLIAPTVRRAAGILGDEPLAVRQEKLRTRVARRIAPQDVKRVSELLGEMIGTPFDDEAGPLLRAARADRVVMGDQMRRAWEDWLRAEASECGILVVLEDVHAGDRPSLTLIERALRNVSDRGWMAVAFGRPEATERFPRLWAERGADELRLAPLPQRASERLARVILGERATPERVQRVLDRGMGNAFFLEEAIRAEAAGRAEQVPDALLAMVDARLAALPAESRRVLRAASVFGETFWRGAVATLLSQEARPEDVTTHLDDLVRDEWIVQAREASFADESEYSFRHSVLRDAAYRSLVDEERSLGHRLAGAWLERVGEGDADTLAQHFARGGDANRAIEWLVRSAEQALAGNDFDAVLARVSEAVVLGAQGETLGWMKRLEAEAHRWRGEWPATVQAAEAATALSPPGSVAWCEAAGEIGAAYGNLGEIEKLVELGAAFDRVLDGPDPCEPAVIAAARAARTLAAIGQREACERLLARCTHVAARFGEGHPAMEARLRSAEAMQVIVTGDTARYVELYLAAVRAFQAAGDDRTAALALSNVAHGLLELGDAPGAERVLRESIAASERLALKSSVSLAKHNLGYAVARNGDVGAGRRIEREAVDELHAQGDRVSEGTARATLAEIALLEGDRAEAEREARLALELLVGKNARRARALAVLARALLHGEAPQAQREEALARATEALSLLESLGGIDAGGTLVALSYAEALSATGDRPRAEAVIADSCALIATRAAKISDPRRRADFLARNAEHALTFALARAWGVPHAS